MPAPTQHLRAFTLIEMLVVMAVIALLAAILLNLNGLVQSKAAKTRALSEIHALESGIGSYKADNGSVPQDAVTDALDPRMQGDPKDYKKASLTLYMQLSGDLNANGRNEPNAATPEPKSYLTDFFTPQRMATDPNKAVGTANHVLFIKDPYGNSYGYSTKGADAEQKFRADTSKPRAVAGYNSTFDLWCTAGKTTPPGASPSGDVTNVWIKNW